jgi:hypothetical protein
MAMGSTLAFGRFNCRRGNCRNGHLNNITSYIANPLGFIVIMPKKRILGEKTIKECSPIHVRLPGFITDKEVGLGEVIQRLTYAVGFKPCAGCDKRAAALNRRIVFTK